MFCFVAFVIRNRFIECAFNNLSARFITLKLVVVAPDMMETELDHA